MSAAISRRCVFTLHLPNFRAWFSPFFSLDELCLSSLLVRKSSHWVFLLFHFANTITNSLSHGLRAQTQPIYVTNQYAKFGAKIVN